MEFLIVTGLSGAGKTQAAHFLEDMGYYCVDNMPSALLQPFAEFCIASQGRFTKVALVTDVRAHESFEQLFRALDSLRALDCTFRILFLEAPESTLIRRYKETRRRHPLAEPGKTVFTLELMDSAGEPFDKVKPDGLTITTDGAVSYDGSVIIKGTLQDLLYHLANGVFVRQQNKGEDGWEYDPAVWYVQVIPKGSGDSVDEVTYAIYPAKSEETGDGGWLYSPTGEMKDKMIFTNTYTYSSKIHS